MTKQHDETLEDAAMDAEFPSENKHDRFLRIANYRMQKAVQRMRQMHNLASANYAYDDDEADKLCNILSKEVETLRRVLKRDVGDLPSLF